MAPSIIETTRAPKAQAEVLPYTKDQYIIYQAQPQSISAP